MRQESIFPGQPWLDTSGNAIQAHGGAVYYEDGVYSGTARIRSIPTVPAMYGPGESRFIRPAICATGRTRDTLWSPMWMIPHRRCIRPSG